MRLVKDEYIDLFKKIGSEDIFQMTRDGTLDLGGLTMRFYRNCQVLKENLVCVFRTFYTCVIIHLALVKKKKKNPIILDVKYSRAMVLVYSLCKIS